MDFPISQISCFFIVRGLGHMKYVHFPYWRKMPVERDSNGYRCKARDVLGHTMERKDEKVDPWGSLTLRETKRRLSMRSEVKLSGSVLR